jgi:hypothetical protein
MTRGRGNKTPRLLYTVKSLEQIFKIKVRGERASRISLSSRLTPIVYVLSLGKSND